MSEKIIAWGVIGLLIYTPLGFGGAELTAFLLEFGSGALFCVWLVNRLWRRRHHPPKIIFPAFLGIAGLFCGWLGLQLLPLPGGLVHLLSPNAYRLYAEAADATATAIPAWLSLSICPSVTEWEFAQLLAYIAVFVMLINTLRSPKQINRLVAVILAMGFGESIYGFSQLAGQTNWVLTGTFVNRNHFAGYLEMTALLAFGAVFGYLGKSGAAPLQKFVQLFEEHYLKALLLLFAALVMICALLLTGSRGGIVSFTLGMSFLGFLAYTRRLLRKWALAMLIFALFAVGSGVFMHPERVIQQLSALVKPEAEESFQLRGEVWQNTLLLVRDFPLSGSGFGTFAHLFRRYQQFPSNLFFTHAENDYLQLVAETGIIGAALLLGAGGLFCYRAVTTWKRQRSRWAIALGTGGLSALFSLVLHSGVDFNLHIPANALLFSVVAALSYSAIHAPKKKGRKRKILGQRSEVVKPGRAALHAGPTAAVLILALFYLYHAASAYYAFDAYAKFVDLTSQSKQPDAAVAESILDRARQYIQTAIWADRKNPAYYAAWGSYLYRNHLGQVPAANPALAIQDWPEAESWLRQAVRRDPANPWYYYELASLSLSRGDCAAAEQSSCLTTRYFQAALQNAPLNLFLRAQVGLWTYRFDQPQAFRLIQEVAARDAQTTTTLLEGLWPQLQDYHLLKKFLPETPAVALEFAKFLYAKRLDYESDLEAARVWPPEKIAAERCQATFIRQTPQEIELGNDDGTAEWRTYLAAETVRVKKVICLPENLGDYHSAALKILLNSGVPGDFIAAVSIDDHLLERYAKRSIPYAAAWAEIPFDNIRLQGKSQITVYIRVTEASASGNYLQIMGDQDTVTTRSVFNFDSTDDLSYDQGKQTGEYMIRLMLRK